MRLPIVIVMKLDSSGVCSYIHKHKQVCMLVKML